MVGHGGEQDVPRLQWTRVQRAVDRRGQADQPAGERLAGAGGTADGSAAHAELANLHAAARLAGELLDRAPVVMFVADAQLRLVQANRAAAALVGEPAPGAALDLVLAGMLEPSAGEAVVALAGRVLAGGAAGTLAGLGRRGTGAIPGSQFDGQARLCTLLDGAPGVAVYLTPAAGAAGAAGAPAGADWALEVVRSISDGLVVVDGDWRIIYRSGCCGEMADQDSAPPATLWEQFPELEHGEAATTLRRAMEDQSAAQVEIFCAATSRWYELRAYPLRAGLAAYLLDVTERRQAEEALRQSEQRLRALDRSKDEFLAVLGHELRNPLAPLRNAAEILLSGRASATEREMVERLIVRQTDHMTRLIDDLLDVARINEGKIELRRAPVSLQAVFNNALHVSRPTCEDNRQTLVVTLPETPVVMDVDATRIEQVLGNLLGNACKYSGPGSRIELSGELSGDGREVVIRIKDNGLGIDPEVLPRIFDMFVQCSRTLDRAHGGLGIGLTIAHRLVQLHGGSIEAHSDGIGQGAEFIVRLPAAKTTLASEPPGPAASEPPRHLRILIVDDNQDAATSMATLQRLDGHEVRVAHSGEEALLAAQQFVPQVVLLDLGLPGMDGFEVARRLRQLPGMDGAFLVALTGYGSRDDCEHAIAAGCDKHLVKPADPEVLREWLEGI